MLPQTTGHGLGHGAHDAHLAGRCYEAGEVGLVVFEEGGQH